MPEHDIQHFADDIVKCILSKRNYVFIFEFRALDSKWRHIITGLCNGLVPVWRHAIIWTCDDPAD